MREPIVIGAHALLKLKCMSNGSTSCTLKVKGLPIPFSVTVIPATIIVLIPDTADVTNIESPSSNGFHCVGQNTSVIRVLRRPR